VPDGRTESARPTAGASGVSSLTRRRFCSQAGEAALAFYAASSPLLAACTQAPITAHPITAGAPSGDHAAFQIMALLDYAVPPGLQTLRVPDAKDQPLGGSYGRPHIMERSLIEFATDRDLLYDGDATPPWSAPNLDKLKAHIYGRAASNIRDADFSGILFINGEGDHWHEVDGKGDNCWNAVNTLEGAGRAAPICISWVDALRQACPRALIGWYAKPAGAEFNKDLPFLKQLTSRQGPLLESLDILSPSLYVWYEAHPDGFDRALARFRDKLAWVRDTYPHKLLCPTAWEEFYLGGSWHARGPDEACPTRRDGHKYWATVPTYNGKTGEATCAQPSFSRAQWDSMLDMIVSVGCDGIFYWATANSWGKYFTDANEPGIRGLLALAERLDGATPHGDHAATFYMDRGPFAR
jgi:hypothetical protein